MRSYEFHAVRGKLAKIVLLSGERSCETHVCSRRLCELMKFAVENKAVRKRRADCESRSELVVRWSTWSTSECETADASQPGELKRVRRAETSPPTLPSVLGRVGLPSGRSLVS